MFGPDPAQVVGADEDEVGLHEIVCGEVDAVRGVVRLPTASAFQVEQVGEYGLGGVLALVVGAGFTTRSPSMTALTTLSSGRSSRSA